MKIFIVCLLILALATAHPSQSEIFATKDSIFGDEKQESGLLNLDDKGDDMFYWLFQSRNDPANDPLVLWLTGGPGCSSELAVFAENGPFKVNDDLSLKTNPNSWNNKANLLYVDQPVGTGFSHATLGHYTKNEKEVAEDFYKFLLLFLEKYPTYKGRPFFITGESYAGHYIPAITDYIIHAKNKDINIKAAAIGNGLVDPYLQYPEYNTFAYENKLIGGVQHTLLTGGFKVCQLLIDTKIGIIALEGCQLLVTSILGNPMRFNVYDIREKCEKPPLCYDFSNIDRYMAQQSVKEALGVGDRKWSECDTTVHTKLLGDWMYNLAPKVSDILEAGVKILVYSGDKDFICNWRGGEKWTHDTKWSGQAEFQKTEYADWMVNGKAAGQMKTYKNFTFLRVYNAGHMVPMDQPENASSMLDTFLSGQF